MSKRKLEATRANQQRKQVSGNRRLPPAARGRTGRRPPWPWIAIGVVVVAIAAGVGAFAATRGGGGGTPKAIDWSQLQGLQTGPAPWTPGLDQLSQRLDVIGLDRGTMEGQVQHTHQHLDIWVDGKKIKVPQDVGINEVQGYLTELHTHDATGVVHLESSTKREFTLGEFFAVWGVKLTNSCLGRYCAGGAKELRAWLNGRPLRDPASLVLKEHQEIAIAYGTPAQMPKKVPASYKFPAGL